MDLIGHVPDQGAIELLNYSLHYNMTTGWFETHGYSSAPIHGDGLKYKHPIHTTVLSK